VPQIKELTTNYGQLDIFCFDNSNESKKDYAVKQKEAALTGQTNIIFNTKIGYNLGGDFETADNSLPVYSTYTKPWEANISHNGTNGFKTKDVNFKPAVDVLKSLIDVTSKGGNFVLNLGPDANGVIPAASAAQLKKVGKWLKVNGESVYGTTASPFTYLNWGKVTKKGMKLYVHVFDYPADGKIKLPITTDIAKSYLLTNPKIAVKAKKEGNYTTLQLPLVSPDSLVSVFVLDLKVEPISTITVPVPSIGKTVTSSSQDADAKFTITNVLDGLDRTVWKAGVGDINSFIEIDLGQETSIGAISIDEGGGKQVKKFKLEYKVGEEYKTVFEGTDVGVAYMKKFAPVKAQIFKLTFLEAKKELQIKDILLFFEE
jgi:alpha-L-fucosidase